MSDPRDCPTPAPPRKPYHAPKLEYLGTTRTLTLGTATIGPADAKGTAHGRKGG